MYPFVSWAERLGLDVSYCADFDIDRDPSLLLKHKVVIFVGHPEYWSARMRTALEQAINSGVSVLFLAGNVCYWQVRFSADSNGIGQRRITCYKDRAPAEDPLRDSNPELLTTQWRNVRDPKHPEQNFSEAGLVGVQYLGQYQELPPVPMTLNVPQALLWMLDGTGLSTDGTIPNAVGYEADSLADQSPPSTLVWSQSQLNAPPGVFGHSTVYHTAGEDIVASFCSMDWNSLLDPQGPGGNPKAQRLTLNVLNRMLNGKFATSVSTELVKYKVDADSPLTLPVSVTSGNGIPAGIVQAIDPDGLIRAAIPTQNGIATLTIPPISQSVRLTLRYLGNNDFNGSSKTVKIKIKGTT
jgi:hypothetical protein